MKCTSMSTSSVEFPLGNIVNTLILLSDNKLSDLPPSACVWDQDTEYYRLWKVAVIFHPQEATFMYNSQIEHVFQIFQIWG